jgi:flagellar biosynthetic protein FliP
VKVVSSSSLGQRERVVVVEIDGTWLVLGVTASQINTAHAAGQARDHARHGRHGHAGRPATPARPLRAEVSRIAGRQEPTDRMNPRIVLRSLRIALALLAATLPLAAWTQGLPGVTSTPGPGGSQTWSLSVQTLMMLTSLTFLPALMLSMTSFTRILIVLGLLRTAIGTQSSPPNQVLVGLSLFLTFFVMSPVFDKVYADAYKPFSENKITVETALTRGIEPFKSFMLRQTRENDLALFAKLAKVPEMQGPEDVPLRILLPAFVISELKTAFQIGFTIFIPFLIIDMVVASVLMSMGMMMVPPASIALPFKLMLFVLADGWQLLIGALAQSFFT